MTVGPVVCSICGDPVQRPVLVPVKGRASVVCGAACMDALLEAKRLTESRHQVRVKARLHVQVADDSKKEV